MTKARVLTPKEIKERWPLSDSKWEYLIGGAIERGYNIALIEFAPLTGINELVPMCKRALSILFPNRKLDIHYLVDMSECHANKVYIVFSTGEYFKCD